MSPERGRAHWRNSSEGPAIAYFHAALGRALLRPLLLHYFSFNSNYAVIIQQTFPRPLSCGKPGAHLPCLCSRSQCRQSTGLKPEGLGLSTRVPGEFAAPSPRARAGAGPLAAPAEAGAPLCPPRGGSNPPREASLSPPSTSGSTQQPTAAVLPLGRALPRRRSQGGAPSQAWQAGSRRADGGQGQGSSRFPPCRARADSGGTERLEERRHIGRGERRPAGRREGAHGWRPARSAASELALFVVLSGNLLRAGCWHRGTSEL